MKHLKYISTLALILAVVDVGAHSQIAAYNGFCQLGGTFVSTVGMNSTTKVQASYPKCTVTVYATGTTNLSTLFSNALSSPLSNPFQANTDGSILFFASTSGCYDIVTSVSTSGGTPPMPNNFTYTDVCLGGGGGGGGGGIGPGTVNRIAKFVTPTNVGNSTGFDDGASLVQWPNGLTVMGSAYGHLYPNSASGTTANYLACIDPTSITVAEVTTCPTSTTKALGIVHAGTAGITGNAQIASLGFDSCVFDNQTVVGDYAGPSATVGGQCTDLGGTRPASIQGVGRVTTLNAGAGTAAIIDLGPWDLFAPGSSGAGQCSFNNANAYFSGGNLVCDQFVADDGNGNLTAKSLGLTDVTQAGFYYLKQGAQPAAAPLNTRMDTVPASVTTYTVIHPGVPCSTIGQTEIVQSTSTDSNGHTVVIMTCGTAGGGGVEAQVGGVDNANCTAGVCPLINFVAGSNVIITNTSGGNVQITASGGTAAPQAANPTAPTLANQNAAGARSITYGVQGCEDGPTCADHSQLVTATIANANASPQVLLSAYADTLYGYRCYDIYVTADSGARTGVPGRIANCVGKKFIDTGANAGGVAATNTNTTVLDANGLTIPLPGCNSIPKAPSGIDTPPCSPNAMDDEFTYTFGAPGDANSPFWTWVNQQTTSITLTNGMASFTGATANQMSCVFQPLPSPPYTYVMAAYITSDGNTGDINLALYETSSGKIEMETLWSQTNEVRRFWAQWNSVSSGQINSTSQVVSGPFAYLKVNRTGSTLNYYYSPDGIGYTTDKSHAVNEIFTTAPDKVGICFNTQDTSGTFGDVDWFRRTQ